MKAGVNYPFTALCCSVLLLSHIAAARAEDERATARQWLNRMAHAERTSNYEGTFVYRRGEKLVAMRVTHVVDTHGERERLVTLNGVRREVLRDAAGVTAILPDENLVLINKGRLSHPIRTKLMEGARSIDDHYIITDTGLRRTMGQQAQVIDIKPRDKYRYGYRLWIDRDTGLMLQSDVLDKGDVMEQIMFTSLKILDKAPPLPKEKIKPLATVMKSDKSVPVKDDHHWQVKRVPDGFHLVEHRKRTAPSGGGSVSTDHLVYTDGLASVSVFIESQSTPAESPPMVGISHVGAVNAYRTVVGRHQVTVVGEVPVNTVRLIGESISYHVTH